MINNDLKCGILAGNQVFFHIFDHQKSLILKAFSHFFKKIAKF